MPRPQPNPFYAVLGVVGFLFTLTALNYCLTALRGSRPAAPAAATSSLLAVIDRHGTAILAGELVVLAIATVGAIALDDIRGRRPGPRDRSARPSQPPDGDP